MNPSYCLKIIAAGLFVFGVMCSGPVQAQETERQPDRQIDLKLPLIEVPDGIDSITFGIGWNVLLDQPVSQMSYESGEHSVRIADGSWRIQSAGKWLLDEALNQRPLTFALGLDTGMQYVERPPDIYGDGGLIAPDEVPAPPFSRELLHSYRLAITLETGLETDQRLDFIYAHAGPGLMLINMPTAGPTAIFPTISLFYEGVFELENKLNEEELFKSSHGRLRLVQEHVFSLDIIGLSRLMMVGGYHYTRDMGQTVAWNSAGLKERFGWFTELGLETHRFSGSGTFSRMDIFIRYTDGELAPLFETQQSVTLGIRLPYYAK